MPCALLLCALTSGAAVAQSASPGGQGVGPRIVHADIVALDQLIVYNRFGSFDPYGMVYALRRDVSETDEHGSGQPFRKAADCQARDGTEAGTGTLEPGEVRLKDCKRPRPLVLRANAGDILDVTFTNLLRPAQPDISETFCRVPKGGGRDPEMRDERANASLLCAEKKPGGPEAGEPRADWPATRRLSLVVPGLELMPAQSRTFAANESDPACRGLDSVPPGGSFRCRFRLAAEGTHLFSSLAAASGGEGDGGSLVHGLFGALIVEPKGSSAYRSQLPAAAFDAVWKPAAPPASSEKSEAAKTATAGAGNPHIRTNAIDFDAAGEASGPCGFGGKTPNVPVANVHLKCGHTETVGPVTYDIAEIVHGDLNAIVVPRAEGDPAALEGETARPFREFTTIFHDELKTYYADAFEELGKLGPLSGVRDGFGINYGSSGLGAMVIANRKKIGPARDCVECLYEEFFLESWANGDPALLESYPDDPSNVHHSYLNDRVVFRNFHAGPKETHVFHLHSHQWFAGNDGNRGAYLDSQTIGPQQGFSYWIYQGGLDRYARKPDGKTEAKGYWQSLGSGNRNRTPGDAIFHCHLYPHFAQGMWELWRVHDVLEDGTRTLPDGQREETLSLAEGGSGLREGTSPIAGPTRAYGAEGTPIPGLLPVPGQAAPLLPTYGDKGMPGYPFYVAGAPGRRAPQAPLDIAAARDKAANDGRDYLDGGLPRHVVTGGKRRTTDRENGKPVPRNPAEAVALGDMTVEFESLDIKLLPYEGTAAEQRAMAFHHNGKKQGMDLSLLTALGDEARYEAEVDGKKIGYPSNAIGRDGKSVSAKSGETPFAVNGAPPKPGAPFADPCGAPDALAGTPLPDKLFHGQLRKSMAANTDEFLIPGEPAFEKGVLEEKFTPDPGMLGFRRFEVSAVQLDKVVSKSGWHDPQARINVLSAYSAKWKNQKLANAEPFFFRAYSGECIEFRHTNETPKVLERDDFQMKVPTDTIGQHIHLVKFDVTSSDGSGNGFNYEDGTFAPDEILERLCASRPGTGNVEAGEAAGATTGLDTEREALCPATTPKDEASKGGASKDGGPDDKKLWPERLSEHRPWFQTTVQRWFADPILSPTGDDAKGDAYAGPYADRTMRTVFTHDHFTPSNIQQHGFYSALLIEPATHKACVYTGPQSVKAVTPEEQQSGADGLREFGKAPISDNAGNCLEPPQLQASEKLPFAQPGDGMVRDGSDLGVGTDARVVASAGGANPYHRDYREFALAVADFALLYDGNTTDGAEPIGIDTKDKSARGLPRLAGEALGDITSKGDGRHEEDGDEDIIPAEYKHEGQPGHPWSVEETWIRDRGLEILADAQTIRNRHGRPVYPPVRPEAISQQHHDPYLLNYRTEPVPLRVGAKEPGETADLLGGNCRDLNGMPFNHGDVKFQAGGERGDMGNLFRTAVHGDPCTPVLDTISGEDVVFRVIQGAQEVQHLFTVEGRPFRRNPDQQFPSGARYPENMPGPTRWMACMQEARKGRPEEFEDWLEGKRPNDAFWQKQETLLAECDNVDGYVSAQEIGISEHFELAGSFLNGNTTIERLERPDLAVSAALQGVDSIDKYSSMKDIALASAMPVPRDALIHLGSTDALWNGAWALLRIHPERTGSDLTRCLLDAPPEEGGHAGTPTKCLSSTQKLEDRLLFIPPGRAKEPPPGDKPEATGPTDPKTPPGDQKEKAQATGLYVSRAPRDLDCPAGAPVRYQAVAAVAAADVAPERRLVYASGEGGELYDPDGLLFVPLDLDQVRLTDDSLLNEDKVRYHVPKPLPGDPTEGRRSVDRASLLKTIRQKFARDGGPQPLVLRMKAGDCLHLAVINAMTDTDPSSGGHAGLPDRPGDATMPRIVPLNTDDERSVGRSGSYDLSPSARLALSIAVSGTTSADQLPSPVGVNGLPGLAPATPNEAPWYAMTLYGGRMFLPEQAIVEALGPEIISVDTPTGDMVTIGLAFNRSCLDSEYYYPIFGIPACASLKAAAQDITQFWTEANAGAIGDRLATKILTRLSAPREVDGKLTGPSINIIPYAFGALPIKSLGDPIGHGPHGLAGMLVVEPRGTEMPQGVAAFNYAATLRLSAVAEDGGPTTAMPPFLDAAVIREQALLWQDGLNLWDRDAPTYGSYGIPGRPVPDCIVCDDSYDRGEKGVSYASEPLFFRFRETWPHGDLLGPAPLRLGGARVYSKRSDLNGLAWPRKAFSPGYAAINTPQIDVDPGQEAWIRIVAAPGRARQRAFVVTGTGYQDIFPGFGSGHSTLLASGKAATAAMQAPSTPMCSPWFDGPRPMLSGGAWGLLCATDPPEAPAPAPVGK